MRQDNRPVMVSIQCLVYNHEPYLRDCLNGFVMQKTNFRFEAIVHDDCSTDNSADIIREYAKRYPDIIKPIFEKENQYSKHDGSISHIMDAASTGRYIALCEGDDYWIDPNKLQIQFDFMESHSNYSMCFHTVNIEENGKITHNDKKSDIEKDLQTEDFICGGGGFCGTCSLFLKSEIRKTYPKFRQIATVGDYPLQVFAAASGKVHYFPQTMSVYRYESVGSWTSRNQSRMYNQFLNDFVWLKEFDKFSDYKYHKAIYKQFAHYDIYLYKCHKRSLIDYYSDSKASGLSTKLALKYTIVTFCDIKLPFLLKAYVGLKQKL